MSSKKPPEVSSDQGALLDIKESNTGHFDPQDRMRTFQIDVAPEGVFGDEPVERSTSEDISAATEVVAASTDLRQRVGHLALALDNLAQANMRRSFVHKAESDNAGDLAAQYGPHLEGQASGAGFNHNVYTLAARKEFKAGYELGEGTTAIDDPAVEAAFGSFLRKFNGTNKKPALDKQRKAYRKLAALTGESQPGDRYMVDAKVESPVVDLTPEESEEPLLLDIQSPELKALNTPQRLVALRDDARAAFLPATNREKNQALAFLDYMDSPKYPANLGNQFMEIFRRQRRLHKGDVTVAQHALQSIGFELGDYFEQALDHAAALRVLRDEIDDCPNPQLTLREAFGPEHPGFAPLFRYMDGSALREKATRPTEFDPLRSRANRRDPRAYEGKNKTVEDSYTGARPRDYVRARIVEQAEELKIGSLRKVIDEALANELQRASFWQGRLYDGYKHSNVWNATSQVLMRRGLPLNPRKLGKVS